MKAKRSLFRAPNLFASPFKYGAPVFIGFSVIISGLDAHAGDILRGGGRASNGKPVAGGGSSGSATPANTDIARANARDVLARTNRTRDAMLAMQNAARLAALANSANHLSVKPANLTVKLPVVPNGLGVGGLQVATAVATDPTKWTGADAPTQTVSKGKTTVTIKQTSQQALLNWDSFNIGKKTTLTFDQSAGGADVSKWIAFNKINDPSGNPTQILGSIKADGQVYIINQNGVIFGGGSQVNARGLTVSSLPINDNLITRGILNNPDTQFLFSGLDLPAGSNGTPAFTPQRPYSPDGKYGDVIVEQGAILNSPTDSAHVGGRITLVGPNVDNQGTISTPDGQTILASGLQVGFFAHSSTDPSLRGLDVYIGAVTDPTAGLYAGTVTQQGLIEAPRGNITLAGRQINQLGMIDSSTSVSLNGRVDLIASYDAIPNTAYDQTGSSGGSPFLYQSSGTVEIGDDSVIRILPELDSKETTIGTELALRSQVNISGKAIHLGKNSVLLAPNALVNLSAGEWYLQGGSSPTSTFIPSAGQLYLDENALVDVSGSANVAVPVSQNIISVDLRGAELADSPLQRYGFLRNATVQVDIRDQGIYQSGLWIGTPLANLSGFANLIQKSVGQLTVAGGSVNISAGASVVMQTGSKVDVSGGSILFQGGEVKTTQLIAAGRLVDISKATPDVVYSGIYDGMHTEENLKFGVSNVFSIPLAPDGSHYEAASIQGGAGGKLSISAPSMVLDGALLGRTVNGDGQRSTPATSASLTLSFLAKDNTYPTLPDYSPSPPSLIFGTFTPQSPAEAFALDANGNPLPLAADRVGRVQLSPGIMTSQGFGMLTLNNPDGEIIVPAGVTLNAPAGGVISFKASTIDIEGAITAPGGKITLQCPNISLDTLNSLANSSSTPSLPDAVDGAGIFTLGSNASISTAGLLVDDRLNLANSGQLPLFLNGGSVTINAFSAELTAGGSLDVSGGALVDPRGTVTYGKGGSIAISTGRDLNISGVLGGHLSLGASMKGFSGISAGSLSIAAAAIQIGGSTSNSGVTLLQEDFFNQGGFGTFSLTGTGLASDVPSEFVTGIKIASDARIHPIVSSFTAVTGDSNISLREVTQVEGVRAPGSISFSALSGNDPFTGAPLGRGDLLMEQGAVIRTDPKGSVSLSGETVTLLGSVTTPGGTINVAGSGRFPSGDPSQYLPTVLIGGTASLSAAGQTLILPNPLGLRQGQVLAGGSVSVVGNIVSERGAVIDVSGTTGILDLPPSYSTLDQDLLNSLANQKTIPVSISSNGGQITLTGAKMLYSDATLIGRAGGSSAIGGTVTVSSGRFVEDGTASNSAEANLVVRQNGFLVPKDFVSRGLGVALSDPAGGLLPGIGNFTVSTFKSGGFNSLALNGNVKFEGDVNITVPGSLRVSSGGAIYGEGKVHLTAAYVNIGQAFTAPRLPTEQYFLFTQSDTSGFVTPYTFSPTHGNGDLQVNAGLVDIGNISLQGIGTAEFNAANGDIRGNGTLDAAGSLTLKAGQIYPTTAGRFNIFAYDFTRAGATIGGSITLESGTARQLPLSAGGMLGVYASLISQGGTLRAPLGTIQIGWDGSGTAPVDAIAGDTAVRPVTSLLTLKSGGLVSVSAVDPITGKGSIIPYGISLDGNSWIDPAGNDITVNGLPAKTVNLAATKLVTEEGSTVDIRGGGDLYAYRWVSGNGGTKDILASSGAFAVIPGYSAAYAPYAPFNPNNGATNLGGQSGYVNATLKVGDTITLAAGSGLTAGTYTLLPARYALLPGAFLITPQSTSPATQTVRRADGSWIATGYRSNDLDASRSGTTQIGVFEVASSKVVRERAEYQDFLADTVLKDAAVSRGFAVPRLPMDAGYLSFSSTAGMTLHGGVTSSTPDSGRGSVIDINSSANILINDTGMSDNSGDLVLSSELLNSFGAQSLLVGGIRSFGEDGSHVTINASNLTLDNPGTALTGSDMILVAKDELHLNAGSTITGSGGGETLDKLVIGNADDIGSGDGTMVRISGSATAPVTRFGVSSSESPNLIVDSNVHLKGGGIVLDSTFGTKIDPNAIVQGNLVALSSGQISVILSNPGTLQPTTGLVLSGDALAVLQKSAQSLSLVSYSSLDFYGTGTVGSRQFADLSLQAASIRGFNKSGGGNVTIAAKNLFIGNPSGSTAAAPLAGTSLETLTFDADQITLGANDVKIEGFSKTSLVSDVRILVSDTGSFNVAGNLDLVTPLVTGEGNAKYSITAENLIQLRRPASGSGTSVAGGLGADLTISGGTVKVDTDILLPSGSLDLHATSGDLTVGNLASTRLDLSGTQSQFLDVTRYSDGGTVYLAADKGSVRIEKNADISVNARTGGGDAGEIHVFSPNGDFMLAGSIHGSAGSSGLQGSFTLDVSKVPGGSLAELDRILNDGNFNQSRDYRVRTGDLKLDGSAGSHIYRVAADDGDIVVSGTIDATGTTGGTIDLKASGNLTLVSGASLDASGADFDAAGKGGAVILEAGNQRNGVSNPSAMLDLQSGSTINLSVATADASSESKGQFTGTLHLRAPRNATNTDLQVAAIGSSITGASSIIVEGVKLYELTGTGTIDSFLQTSILNDANAFLGDAGTTSAAYASMLGRLTSGRTDLDLILAPGVEIYNLNGSITLGSASSDESSDWNLAAYRFGPDSAAGVLTLRASQNLTFYNALSDGFTGGVSSGVFGTPSTSLWQAILMANNPALKANAQSWSFHLTAGADLSGASYRAVESLNSLDADAGLLQLGKDAGAATAVGGTFALTSSVISGHFQVIRTGSGDIDINTGRSLQLLNPFASIYTAGTSLIDPHTVSSINDFVIPNVSQPVSQGNLGSAQQAYIAQYSMAGGNVSITAGENIERKTLNNSGLIDDSSRELPNNWLYRRGLVGPDGSFGKVTIGSGFGAYTDLSASTTWWVDFSNFFQGVGALGGGNVNISAGHDVSNVDAVIPTNARAAQGTPSLAAFLELGGGNLFVKSGNDISGGVYYVERGHGTLDAGGDITTNATRSPSFGITTNLNDPDTARLDPLTWMPTTLFVGDSSFDLKASGDILMGPVANPFLLPQGINNRFWYKSYFSTISKDSSVTAISLGGDVTVRNAVTLPNNGLVEPALLAWYESQLLLTNSPSSTSWFQPWLRLAETAVGDFSPVWSLSAANLSLSSLAGDVNLAGDITLYPSPTGQLEIVASGAVNALRPTGLSYSLVSGRAVQAWTSATINLSDANPDSVPSVLTPLTYFNYSTAAIPTSDSGTAFMSGLASLFTESGSSTGTNAVLQNRQARHTPGGLHSQDQDPLRIYALGGDLSGLTLFSGKSARISAATDLTDVAFYIQNSNSSDVSVVTAGRDIVASDASSPSRIAAFSDGNALSFGQPQLAGDIQISGPGTLEVIAGRNLDLGTGSSNTDGTGTGITSIGNLRNPYLSAAGSNLVVTAGVGPAASLSSSQLALDAFISDFVATPQGEAYLKELAPGVEFSTQPPEQQALLALEVFYRILRDTGRDFNDPKSPDYRKYDAGFEAIKTLFPELTDWNGTILTQSRDIRTRSGGDISITAPGGGLKMSETTIGNPLTPPGIITESGGRISIFADQDVSIGIGRIFTLRGGDVVIWSSKGDIAAGSSSRTIQSAPPTRVIIDPQSASVETDLAGLATGGGIGVLATVAGVKPGDVDLIAPTGIIDAGDAGIRVTGNINLAAISVVNAGNISAGGTSTGTPVAVSAPSVSAVTSAANTAGATTSTAPKPGDASRNPSEKTDADTQALSIFTVEVIGYGGSDPLDGNDEDKDKRDEAHPAAQAPADGSSADKNSSQGH